MERMTSLPAALSPLGTTAQDGKIFQAGAPDGWVNPNSAKGRCVAAIRAVCFLGQVGRECVVEVCGTDLDLHRRLRALSRRVLERDQGRADHAVLGGAL